MAKTVTNRGAATGPLRPPAAYTLALSSQHGRDQEFASLRGALTAAGATPNLDSFLSLVRGGHAAINMTLANCVRFLQTGAWMNVYEAVHAETGATGTALEQQVRGRLGTWYPMRRRVDRMLRFRRDTHYASLNVGGAGANRYGTCCVLLRRTHEPPFATSFGGDSLLSIFDGTGKQIRQRTEVLLSFGTRDDLEKLAAVRHAITLNRRGQHVPPGLDVPRLIGLLENSDSLMEIHLHGFIGVVAIEAVAMRRADRDHYWDLAERTAGMPRPWPREFDPVPFFLEVVKLLDQRGVPLKVVD